MSAEYQLLLIGSVCIPWLSFVTMAILKSTAMLKEVRVHCQRIPTIAHQVHELKLAHAPNADGVMEWKNPEIRELAKQQLDVLTRIEKLMAEEHAKLSQLFVGQSEVKTAVQAMKNRPA